VIVAPTAMPVERPDLIGSQPAWPLRSRDSKWFKEMDGEQAFSVLARAGSDPSESTGG
jgi:hypothetical protein